MMRNERGMTVVGVMVALVLFSVVALGLAGVMLQTSRMVAQGHRYTKAFVFANEQIEILRAKPCDELASGTVAHGLYRIAWTVTDAGNARRVDLAMRSPRVPYGIRVDSLSTYINCA